MGLWVGWGGIKDGIKDGMGGMVLERDYGLVGVGLRMGWGGILGCLGWDYAWSERD